MLGKGPRFGWSLCNETQRSRSGLIINLYFSSGTVSSKVYKSFEEFSEGGGLQEARGRKLISFLVCFGLTMCSIICNN